MPRWIFLVPVAALALASGLRRSPSHWLIQGTLAAVVAGPLMGGSLPVDRFWRSLPEGERLRIATFNVGLDGGSVLELARWAERERIDILCLQEHVQDNPVLDASFAEGWYRNERKTIVSRFPIIEELPRLPEESETNERYSALMERVRVRTPHGVELIVVALHLPTVRPGLERFRDHLDVRGLVLHARWWRREVARVLAHIDETRSTPMLIAGDFNMPSDEPTMAALRSSFLFAFEEAGLGFGYTRPSKYPWIRIDHILAGDEWVISRCSVGPDLGSDHLPLLAEVLYPMPAAPPIIRLDAAISPVPKDTR
jgi:endonuclease/exonuclease/phosphatase (EEP) superfamily protein YafD